MNVELIALDLQTNGSGGGQLEIEDTGHHHSSISRGEKGNNATSFYKEEMDIRDLQDREMKNK